jgi:hypothetical protein
MTTNPADGERNARIGFEAQDKRAASLIYNLLVQGRLEWFHIADPNAGRVDDILIVTADDQLYAYQVKWSDKVDFISFADFIRSSGENKANPSLILQLADGWRTLKQKHPDLRVLVHLIHRHVPSPKSPPKIELPLDEPPPLQPNFQAFIRDCWQAKKEWLHKGLSGIPQGWSSAIETVRQETELNEADFLAFVDASSLHFNYQFSQQDGPISQREEDIEAIARLIFKLGGGERRVIKVTRTDLLKELSWESRFEFRFKHEFPVEQSIYQPITETVQNLKDAAKQFTSGYLALIGPPGTGKSTTLTQTFRYRPGYRIIRYYAYVPESIGQEGRGEASSFLHDLHLALQRQGIYAQTGKPSQPKTLEEFREAFSAQLRSLHEQWQQNNIMTLLVIDGLDHIAREQRPIRSLLNELPPPDNLPEGVLLILGSQTLQLADFPSRIQSQLEKTGRTLTMQPLPRQAVAAIIVASRLPVQLSSAQQETVHQLVNGHPLTLRYLLERLRNTAEEEIDAVLDTTVPYHENIEANYRVYWEQLESNEELKDLLALLARLRGPFNPREWPGRMGEPVVKDLLQQAQHYFREETKTRWHFFHNSFRQFILAQTRRDLFGDEDAEKDKQYHQRLAEFAASSKTFWAWEELYHRAQAQEWEAVLRLGTQQHFRNQFMQLRPAVAIFEDINLCLDAACKQYDGLAIIRALLIEKELSDRKENIDFSEVKLPALLLEVRGLEEALHFVMDGNQLRISAKDALDFASLLIEKGELRAAESVFNAAEPLDLLNGSTEIAHHRADRDTLNSWVKIAHYFRPLDALLHIITQIRADTHFMPQHVDTTSWYRRFQKNMLMKLACAVFDSNDADKLVYLKAQLKSCEKEQWLLRKLDFRTCYFYPESEAAKEAFSRILEEQEAIQYDKETRLLITRFLYWDSMLSPASRTAQEALGRILGKEITEYDDESRLLIAHFLYHIRKDKKAVVETIAGIQQPKLAFYAVMDRHEYSLTPFLARIRLNRLLAMLGQPEDPVQAVPDDKPQEHGAVLFERCVVIVANIWGRAWAGDILSPAILLHELQPALRLSCHKWRDTQKWRYWFAYEKIFPEFYSFLIHAVAEHGQAAVQALEAEFDRLWQEQRQYWQPRLQRKIALELFRQGCSKENLQRHLDQIEQRYGVWDDVGTLASEYAEQIFAWLEAGQPKRAEKLFPQILQNSFGVMHDKDYQFSSWVDLLAKTATAYPELAEKDIRRFAAALVTFATTYRGGGTRDAAIDLVTLIAQWQPGYAVQLKNWLLDQHSIDYEDALSGILTGAALSSDTPIEMICILTCHLLLPFSRNVPDKLPALLAEKIRKISSKAESQELLDDLEQTVATKIFPSQRAGWWRGIAEGLQVAGVDAERFCEKVAQDDKEKIYDPDIAIRLKNGEELKAEDAMLRITSGTTLLCFIDQVEETKYFHWEEVVEKVADTINYTQIEQLRDKLDKLKGNLLVEILLAKRLKALGHEQEGRAFLEELIERSDPRDWDRYFNGGIRLKLMQEMISFDGEEGRKYAFQSFVRDYIATRYGPGRFIENIDNFLPILFASPPLDKIWLEVREHVYQLHEFSLPEEMPPSVPENTSPWENALLQLVADAMKIEVSEIRTEAHLALRWICLSPAYDAASSQLLRSMLTGSEREVLHALAVCETTLEQRPEYLAEFAAEFKTLSSSPNMTVRAMAVQLARALNLPFDLPAFTPLPLTYTLELPDFLTQEEAVPFEALPQGGSFPDTEDPLDMIRPFGDQFELLSKMSGTPLQNLTVRAAILMKSLSPQEQWNKQAEDNMKEWLTSADLKIAYHRLRPQQALKALRHIIAELIDAEKLNPKDAAFIIRQIRGNDRVISCLRPLQRPKEILLPGKEDIREQDWPGRCTEGYALVPEQIKKNGLIVVAELTRIQQVDDDKSFEYRFSMLAHPDEPLLNTPVDAHSFFPHEHWWYAEEYPNLYMEIVPALAVFGSPRIREIGSQEWLAFNPELALGLGWQCSKNGLFSWEDDEGSPMVQSLWWQDGSIHRHNRFPGDVCAEGWLVLATTQAYEIIQEDFVPIIRAMSVIRTNSKGGYNATCQQLPVKKT